MKNAERPAFIDIDPGVVEGSAGNDTVSLSMYTRLRRGIEVAGQLGKRSALRFAIVAVPLFLILTAQACDGDTVSRSAEPVTPTPTAADIEGFSFPDTCRELAASGMITNVKGFNQYLNSHQDDDSAQLVGAARFLLTEDGGKPKMADLQVAYDTLAAIKIDSDFSQDQKEKIGSWVIGLAEFRNPENGTFQITSEGESVGLDATVSRVQTEIKETLLEICPQ